MKSLYALNYLNRKNMTQVPYNNLLFTSVRSAQAVAQNVKLTTKKNMRVVKLVLERV